MPFLYGVPPLINVRTAEEKTVSDNRADYRTDDCACGEFGEPVDCSGDADADVESV